MTFRGSDVYHLTIAVILLAVGVALALTMIVRSGDSSPGPEWVRDHGSIYWACTSDGQQLIKDTDTGGLVLGLDDAKCDAGG